jgi:hypothetical protein
MSGRLNIEPGSSRQDSVETLTYDIRSTALMRVEKPRHRGEVRILGWLVSGPFRKQNFEAAGHFFDHKIRRIGLGPHRIGHSHLRAIQLLCTCFKDLITAYASPDAGNHLFDLFPACLPPNTPILPLSLRFPRIAVSHASPEVDKSAIRHPFAELKTQRPSSRSRSAHPVFCESIGHLAVAHVAGEARIRPDPTSYLLTSPREAGP